MNLFQSIVVPHDFSEYADAALGIALNLSRALDADLHLLHVLPPPAYAYGNELLLGNVAGSRLQDSLDERQSWRSETSKKLEAIARRHSALEIRIRTVLVEGTRIAETIDTEAARLGAQLIVMGTHGRTGLAHLILGSVAEATLRHAPCPVLTVPRHQRIHVESLQNLACRQPSPGAL